MTFAVCRYLLLAFVLLSCAPGLRAAAPVAAPTNQSNACVVLLHGLGRTYRSMHSIEHALQDAGYATISVDYPSQSKPIEALALQAVPEGLGYCRKQGATTIHFVTHSMGGLVLRYYLSTQRVPELGRVVMLSPPNQGSEVADTLTGTAMYDRVNGPAGGQLVTGPAGIAARLGPVDFPLGIITGNEQTVFDSVLATQIPGANDGKVSVERAKVDGMADFLVLPVTHTFIVNNDEVIGQALYFLANGKFRRSDAAGSLPNQAPVTQRK